MQSFVGPDGVQYFRAAVIESALRLYARTGLKANSHYTPKNMMRTASEITGESFKPRAYLAAADALRKWRDSHARA